MVFLGCYKILTLQLQHLQVILVCLPQIAQVGTQSLFQLVALQACILNGNPGIVAFAAAVAIEQVEADGQAEVCPKVAALHVGGNVILVERIAVSAVQF